MEYAPIIISLSSLLFAIYSLVSRNNKENTSELTTVIVKLENISTGIKDIKAEIANLKDDQRDDHDRLIKAESSLTTLWKRFDEMKGADDKV